MRKQAVIATPFPTQEQVAKEMGIGKARMRHLMVFADQILGKDNSASKSAKRAVLLRHSRRRRHAKQARSARS
jgi:hypothetical protein